MCRPSLSAPQNSASERVLFCEKTADLYIFLADNENIAMNIVVCGYLAITLMPDNDACYAIDSFLKNGLECPKCSIVTKMIK